MKIAIPIWQDRVSPVLDTAGQLLVLDMENGQELSRQVQLIPQMHMASLARFLVDLGIDVMICGAVSRRLESLLMVSGIRTIPWVGGSVEDVISAYSDGSLGDGHFFLPGCRFGRGRRRGGRFRGAQINHGCRRKLEEDS